MKSAKKVTLVRNRDGARVVLASELDVAETIVSRNVGLLKHNSLPKGQGLWIKRCNSIHTFFMRFPIDAIFVDKKLKVISVYRDLKPWRITWLHLKATSVIELPAGTLEAAVQASVVKTPGLQGAPIAVGDKLSVEALESPGGRNG